METTWKVSCIIYAQQVVAHFPFGLSLILQTIVLYTSATAT